MKKTSFKRSKKATLVLMVPAATLALSGCGQQETPADVVVFSNAEECAAFYNPPAQCQAAFSEAQTLHPKVAPHYVDKAECEADFGTGQCEQSPAQHQSGSFFMPMMMGFLAGQMMNRSGFAGAGQPNQAASAANAPKNTVPTQPLYKSRDDRQTFRTASNTAVATQPGNTQIRPSAVQPKAATVARRGGFGAQAAKRNISSYGS